MNEIKVPVEVSARHIHLCQEDLDKLFGAGVKLSVKNDVSQPDQFAADETVDVKGPKNTINKVRIVGPAREKTQLEISVTDSFTLGIAVPPVRISGDLDGTPGDLEIIGKSGTVKLTTGVIIAQRHLHIQPELASKYGLANGDIVKLLLDSPRKLIYDNVVVRSHKDIDVLAMQLDTDEANAAYVKNGDTGTILIKE